MNTTMSNIRISASFSGNFFTIRFYPGIKGEKLDKENSVAIATIEYNIKELPTTIYTESICARHGLKQKICDNLAMPKDLKAITTVQSAINMTNSLWSKLIAGNWTTGKIGAKASSMKFTEIEDKFMAAVYSGIQTWENANMVYRSIMGKDLPPMETTEDVETTEDIE